MTILYKLKIFFLQLPQKNQISHPKRQPSTKQSKARSQGPTVPVGLSDPVPKTRGEMLKAQASGE